MWVYLFHSFTPVRLIPYIDRPWLGDFHCPGFRQTSSASLGIQSLHHLSVSLTVPGLLDAFCQPASLPPPPPPHTQRLRICLNSHPQSSPCPLLYLLTLSHPPWWTLTCYKYCCTFPPPPPSQDMAVLCPFPPHTLRALEVVSNEPTPSSLVAHTTFPPHPPPSKGTMRKLITRFHKIKHPPPPSCVCPSRCRICQPY